MPSEFNKGYVGGDFLLEELASPAMTRESKEVENATGDDIELAAGHPMDDNVPVEAGDEANCDGLVVQAVTIPAGDTVKVGVISRFAVINRDALPTVDHLGEDYDMDALGTAIEALEGVRVRREPTEQTEHTT